MTYTLGEESYEQKCEKCGAVNRITLQTGPEHGGWGEKFTVHCAECGDVMDRISAFGLKSVEKVKSK